MLQTPVLIVDDEPAVLEGLQEFLEDEGYDVHLSVDGSDALKTFKRIRPELVVMDLRMPGMPGMEVIRRIREINAETAVLVISGYGSPENMADAIRLNVFDFLSKPIDLGEFKAALDRARDSMQASRKVQEEAESLKQQLNGAMEYLNQYQHKIAELESLALAGRLLAGILHNLNNPLNYISGETQILQMIHPEIKNLDRIDKQVCRMAQIIRSVLRKLQNSQVRREEWLDVNQLLEEEMTFLESHPYFHDIEKEWMLSDDLPLIRGVAADFGQILGNLLSNAAEAMKGQKEKKLTLRTNQSDSEIIIAVQDNGPGIPFDLQDRIFEPFFSTKNKEVGISGGFGMGLGLYSCRQVVRQYKGAIEVMSNPGQGTTFIIYIPKVTEH